ncbi:hypothetical protein P692DRAFT_201840808 [Suillus brevipes Sb2]|nr:hypothetical protein P692DRAFT_201840808 [Suillus brevipes Sb2]
MYRDPENTQSINGNDYLGAVLDGDIKENEFSWYHLTEHSFMKVNNLIAGCMYMWVILNLTPDKRYRKLHVCPGGFILGPNKPKNNSPSCCASNEGLNVWDASCDTHFISNLHLLLTTADSPGLVYWDGMVGHSGKNGGCIYCGVRGRRKTRATHYYSALLKPWDRCTEGSGHPDIDILSPSRCLSVLHCMTTDIMHLAANLNELCLDLWHRTINCGLTDDVATWDRVVLQIAKTWTQMKLNGAVRHYLEHARIEHVWDVI